MYIFFLLSGETTSFNFDLLVKLPLQNLNFCIATCLHSRLSPNITHMHDKKKNLKPSTIAIFVRRTHGLPIPNSNKKNSIKTFLKKTKKKKKIQI